MTRSALVDRLKGFLGGRAAEESVFNEISTGAENDLRQATEKHARLMADSARRRHVYRLQMWLHLLFPAVILVFPACVAVYVIAWFLPLVALIQKNL